MRERIAALYDRWYGLSLDPARVVVTSGKGGVGKSTVSANLAIALAKGGRCLSGRWPGPGEAVVTAEGGLLSRTDRTVVVAAEPLAHHYGLRALTAALTRESSSPSTALKR